MTVNQSLRRTDLGPTLANKNGPAFSEKFAYQPLDPHVDSTRLLHIEPASNESGPLICRLVHATFEQRPKFWALSYVWGDATVKTKLCLNGADFYVGKNLWDALHYLRGRAEAMPFWIDAICINQDDIPERNKQLRMMHHIYSRAHLVLVWLGKKYLKYQNKTLPEARRNQNDPSARSSDQGEPQPSSVERGKISDLGDSDERVSPRSNRTLGLLADNEERDMVHELFADEYWNRLWVIQEIGKASQKQVCFGNMAMDWNSFIQMITLHYNSCEGPLRLNRQLQERYDGGHTLRRLLQDHQNALCKEPRDKVYGLVGLALDASGFKMDYRKSLIEIWTDTMEFMNGRRLLPNSDVISFGRLVKKLLIGNDYGPLEQVLRPYEPLSSSAPTINESDGPGVFEINAHIIGIIRAVGPSATEIVASLYKTDQWTAQIQENFREELGDAHRENDLLMNAILELDKVRLATTCFRHVSCVRWKGDFNYNVMHSYSTEIQKRQLEASKSTWPGDESSSNIRATTGDPYLFQIDDPYFMNSRWRLGVVSSQARPGDLICWTDGTKRAIVVRLSKGQKFQVIGTALITEDIISKDNSHHSDRLCRLRKERALTIKIDASTIYVLLA
jgi:hypothetical protein